MKIEKDTRPVRCYICKKKMYYAGHQDAEPEYRLYDSHDELGYVHAGCIKFLKKQMGEGK